MGMSALETGLYCLIISLLWGVTNPLIKKSTSGITKIQTDNYITRYIYEIKYLVANWKYVLLFLINQGGSVLYFILLQRVDLSLIVPIVNALTFVITGCVGSFVGEKIPNLRTVVGLFFIVVGIIFCILDKTQLATSEA